MLSADLRSEQLRRRRAVLVFVALGLIAALPPSAPAQQPNRARLGNIATRGFVGTGDNVLIGGLIVSGNQPKKVILRAVGPSLTAFGVSGALPDPTLELFRGGEQIATNDNWRSAQEAEIEASGLKPRDELESAIVATLDPKQPYSAIVRGAAGATGVGLVEVYDLDPAADSRLGNISTRASVQTGDNVMIAGTIVVGDAGASQRVLVRAKGPSLPVAGQLPNPTLELVNANGVIVRSNDNWRSEQQAEVIATALPPTNDLEAAVVAMLRPDRYTAIVRGTGGSTGVGLVEVYTVDNPGAWPLAGHDPNLGSTADLEPLRTLIGDSTVVAFGESYHTSGGFYRMKHRVFRYLVEKMGFRAFAIESK
ncbi:MAG TPA: hypothetical protein VF551_09430 [Chthoniobacterales bacterium]|jgi:hypothetical protein